MWVDSLKAAMMRSVILGQFSTRSVPRVLTKWACLTRVTDTWKSAWTCEIVARIKMGLEATWESFYLSSSSRRSSLDRTRLTYHRRRNLGSLKRSCLFSATSWVLSANKEWSLMLASVPRRTCCSRSFRVSWSSLLSATLRPVRRARPQSNDSKTNNRTKSLKTSYWAPLTHSTPTITAWVLKKSVRLLSKAQLQSQAQLSCSRPSLATGLVS